MPLCLQRLLLTLMILAVSPASSAAPGALPVEAPWDLVIDTPGDGVELGAAGGLVFLAGRTPGLAGSGLDLVIAVDVSASTDLPFFAEASPARHAGGWWRPFAPRGPAREDLRGSLLDAELRAAELLLARLHPATTRVGLVAFAGSGNPAGPDARSLVALTSDYPRVRAGLRRLLEGGAAGTTTLVAGLNRALAELLATPSAASPPRPEARRVVLLLTDGAGPLARASEADRQRLRARAARAHRAGVRVDAILIGEEAERDPTRAHDLIGATGGVLTAISSPEHLGAAVAERSFSSLMNVEVANRTSGQPASRVSLHLDGSFAAIVPLVPGPNRIRVIARSASGTQRTRMLEIRYAPEGPTPRLPAPLLLQRTRLLAEHLAALRAQPLVTHPARAAVPPKALEVRTESSPVVDDNEAPPAAPHTE